MLVAAHILHYVPILQGVKGYALMHQSTFMDDILWQQQLNMNWCWRRLFKRIMMMPKASARLNRITPLLILYTAETERHVAKL